MIAAALLTPSHSYALQMRYKLVDIGTLGGPVSYILPAAQIASFSQLNATGTLVGGGGTSMPITADSNLIVVCGGLEGGVPFVNHAMEWQNGSLVDLAAWLEQTIAALPRRSTRVASLAGTLRPRRLTP